MWTISSLFPDKIKIEPKPRRKLNPGNKLKPIKKSAPMRFWEKVKKYGESECWEWQGARNKKNYGYLGVRGKQMLAHRYSAELHTGRPVPNNKLVCHTCDNPPCVNPFHLFIGTYKENMQDSVRKGRRPKTLPPKSHCPNGHPYNETNIGVRKEDGKPYRACLICLKARKQRYQNKNQLIQLFGPR